MKSLCIKTNNSYLLDYLLNELRNTEIKDICFTIKEFKHYKNIVIHYTGKYVAQFYSTISYILSFLVIDELEESFFKKIIAQDYFYFDANERRKILEICFDLFSEDFSRLFNQKFNILYNNFFEYISSNKSLVLTGFINFRLQDYWHTLGDIVNEAVSAFIIEKEYLEFISLLRLYINSQPSTCDIVHVIYSASESILLDNDKNIINDRDSLDCKYLSDISFSSNDYTLNTLLNLIPKRIYVHLVDDYLDEFINTIQSIFEGRVIVCKECDICDFYKNKKDVR